jgi:hypothetical protein
MAVIQRGFYRSARGPQPGDEDWWVLIFDGVTGRIFVRYEWQAAGHCGIDEFEIAEFLEQKGAAQTALIDNLFRLHADARTASRKAQIFFHAGAKFG